MVGSNKVRHRGMRETPLSFLYLPAYFSSLSFSLFLSLKSSGQMIPHWLLLHKVESFGDFLEEKSKQRMEKYNTGGFGATSIFSKRLSDQMLCIFTLNSSFFFFFYLHILCIQRWVEWPKILHY